MATSNFLSSDLMSWYDRINAVRTKSGMGLTALTPPNVTTDTLAVATTIKNFKQEILDMQSNKYMAYADYTSTNNISAESGMLISGDLKVNLETSVSEMERICPNDTTKTNITTSDSTCSTNRTNSTYSNDSTDNISSDRTNSTGSDSTKYTNSCKTWSDSTWGDRLTCPVGTNSTDTDYSTQGTNSTWSTCATNKTSDDSTNTTYSDHSRTYSDRSNSTRTTYSTDKTISDKTTSDTTYTVKQ